jgi:hypothetical protein
VTTTTYAARFLGVDTSEMTTGSVVGTIVGGDTALDSRDGDGSYVVVQRAGVLPPFPVDETQMPFRWVRVDGPAPSLGSVTSMIVEAEYRQDDDNTATPSGGQLGTTFEGVGVSTTGPWPAFTTSYEFALRTVPSTYFGTVLDGRPWLLQTGQPSPTLISVFRLTYLMCIVEGGVPPLRQRNRDDNRARLMPSRQRSIRARGYL